MPRRVKKDETIDLGRPEAVDPFGSDDSEDSTMLKLGINRE